MWDNLYHVGFANHLLVLPCLTYIGPGLCSGSCRIPHKPAGVLFGRTLSLEANHYTASVKKPQVVGVTIDHGHTHEGRGKLVRAEYHGDIGAVDRGRGRARVIVLSQAEGQVIIGRQVATVVPLGVVVELHRRKQIHDVSLTFNRHPLPRDIGGAVKAHHWDKAKLNCLADEGSHLRYQLCHEGRTILKVKASLGNARGLHRAEGTHASLVKAGLAAACAGHRADLVARLVGRSQIKDGRHIATSLTLDRLGICVDVQQFHVNPRSWLKRRVGTKAR